MKLNKPYKAAAVSLFVMGLGIGQAVAADSCKPNAELKTVNPAQITVALTNTPPYSLEKNDQISGIDGDLVKKFAADNCLKISYKIFTYPGAITAVQTHRADIALGGFYRTAARAKVVELSAPVYLDQLSAVSKDGIDTVDGLKGKKVGTVQGYLWVAELQKLFKSDVSTYPTSLNLAQDLHAGRIDVALDGFGSSAVQNQGHDYPVKLLKEDKRINATLFPTQTAFLLDKSNASFVEAMNNAIEQYRKDGLIAETLKAYKLDPSAANVGASRVVE
jgi:polar amino acid transport system substrate-binding protein